MTTELKFNKAFRNFQIETFSVDNIDPALRRKTRSSPLSKDLIKSFTDRSQRHLQYKSTKKMSNYRREPIAVVGIGCRIAGGLDSTKILWDALCQGLDLSTEVPGDRFDINAFHDPDSLRYGAIRNRKGGFVPDIFSFDADFFRFLSNRGFQA